MKNNKIIIGVIGASRHIDSMPNGKQITQLAFEIGQEITISQHILLSGGKPSNYNPALVHSAAMDGAKKAGEVNKPARLISVLRGGSKIEVSYDAEPTCRHLIVQTNYGDERNLINGFIPDVIIAVHGGKGTLTEIAFAHLHNVPVVFIQNNNIDTLKGLRHFTPILLKEAKSILDQTKTKFEFDLDSVSKVDDLINDSSNTNTAASAKEAVDKAITIAKRSGSNDLPGNDELNGFLDTYRLKLNELAGE